MPNAQALIVDDNLNNIRVLNQLLTMENIGTVRLSGTANLSNNLDSIEGIDVVFLDLEMPDSNGYEALQVIRAHPNFKSAKVVAYTVHVSEFNSALDMGFDAFLGKPVSAEAFPEQLKRILRGEKLLYLP